jgi:hypothetical protein
MNGLIENHPTEGLKKRTAFLNSFLIFLTIYDGRE